MDANANIGVDLMKQQTDTGTDVRTTALDGSHGQGTALQGHSCAWCRGPVPPRKRNGYCSDRCRKAARRLDTRVDKLISTMEHAAAELRSTLFRTEPRP